MTRHPVRKGAVALATAVSVVALMAAPAASQPEIQGGFLYVGGTPQNPTFTFPFGDDAPPKPCKATLNNGVQPFQFHTDKEANVWWTTGGFAGVTQFLGTWIKAVIDFGGLAGNSVPGPPGDKVLNGGGQIVVHLWEVQVPDPPDPDQECEKEDFVCTLTVDIGLIQPSFYTGPNPPVPGMGIVEFNANSVAPHIGAPLLLCGLAIWVTFNGQPAFLRDLVISPAR